MKKFASPYNKLTQINRRIRDLKIPFSEYVVFATHGKDVQIFEMGEKTVNLHKDDKERNIRNMIVAWLEKQAVTRNIKFITAEIVGEKWMKPIISDLWLKEDIVPYFIEAQGLSEEEGEKRSKKPYVKEFRKRFNLQDLVRMNLYDQNEVEIAELVTLDDYKHITHYDEFALLLNLAEEFRGKKMIFINATPQGGGVALMRHALIRLYKLLGVDAKWYVLYALKEAFDITKTKFHNVLQAVSDEDTYLTDEDKALYDKWIADNAEQLLPAYKDVDVIVIDDPQPVGLIPFIRKANPKAKILYRSHIQIESHLANKPGTPQYNTWQFIWKCAKEADLFISHPMKQFVPKDVPIEKNVMMPATTDALDGLNKPLSPRQADYYLKLFDRILIENGGTPLDKRRPYIIQIARFDPSKGIPDVIEAYRVLVQKLKKAKKVLPQLVICGHGSIDDPDGVPIFNLTMEMLQSKKYQHLADDVKVARLYSSDQILNALLQEAKIALQLSHKEGFEVKVSEALMKGVPIVAYQAGGIPLQVKEGVSGYLVPVGDTDAVANRLYKLCTNDELYYAMKRGALENVNAETSTVANAIKWLFLGNEMIKKGKIIGNGKHVIDLIKKKYSNNHSSSK